MLTFISCNAGNRWKHKEANLGLFAPVIWRYSQLTATVRKPVERRHRGMIGLLFPSTALGLSNQHSAHSAELWPCLCSVWISIFNLVTSSWMIILHHLLVSVQTGLRKKRSTFLPRYTKLTWSLNLNRWSIWCRETFVQPTRSSEWKRSRENAVLNFFFVTQVAKRKQLIQGNGSRKPCGCAWNSVHQFHTQQEIWVQAVTGKVQACECNYSQAEEKCITVFNRKPSGGKEQSSLNIIQGQIYAVRTLLCTAHTVSSK